jgi:glutamate synthase domain-containing protein 3
MNRLVLTYLFTVSFLRAKFTHLKRIANTAYYCRCITAANTTLTITTHQDAIENKTPISMEMPINNLDRTTGTILSYEISTRYGEAGLPDDTIHVKFTGHAGQSLGFCLAKGVHLEVL